MTEQHLVSEKMAALLEQHHQWPSVYKFKFIVPATQVEALLRLLPAGDHSQRPSAKGTFISVTADLAMPSAQAVLAIYEQVAAIEGLIAL